MEQLSHFDADGKAVMVDVGNKQDTQRFAQAHGFIVMTKDSYETVKCGTMQKGDVLGVARLAGIMAAKKTADLIPLCHILLPTHIGINFIMHDSDCMIETVCDVATTGKTGAEMEALTGVSVALLTIYDMCKAIDKTMRIFDITLLKKSGGKSGLYERQV